MHQFFLNLFCKINRYTINTPNCVVILLRAKGTRVSLFPSSPTPNFNVFYLKSFLYLYEAVVKTKYN